MIIVDAFGGDNSPDSVIKGAVLAKEEYNKKITLVGDEQKIKEVFSKYSLSDNNIDIINASEVISLNEEPALAIRRKKDSSIVVGCRLLKENENSVFISAGSTGALLAGGLFVTGRIKGIERPALSVMLPGKNKPILLIDSGANAECKSEHLNQFAMMGSVYMNSIYSVKNPKVALINIGSEEEKGTPTYKEAYKLLRDNEKINFKGNMEARELLLSDNDVGVCDGFTGNMILKTVEGMASFMKSSLKDVFYSSTKTKLGALLVKNELGKTMKKMDYTEYGGAPFLGVNGGLIKAHGSSDEKAIKNAIRQAILFKENNVLYRIKENL